MNVITSDVVTVTLQGISGEIEAKIDTGATQTSLHADDISVTDEHVVFKLNGRTYRAPLETEQQISSSDGGVVSRPVIRTVVTIDGQEVDTMINLNDRSDMPQPMLIGQDIIRSAGLTLQLSDDTAGEEVPEGDGSDVDDSDGASEDPAAVAEPIYSPVPNGQTDAPDASQQLQQLRQQSLATLNRMFKLQDDLAATKTAMFELVKAISDYVNDSK